MEAVNPPQLPIPPTFPNPVPTLRLHQLGLQHRGQSQGALPKSKNLPVKPGSSEASAWPSVLRALAARGSPVQGPASAAGADGACGDRQELGLRISSLWNVSYRPSHFQLA